jgi:hypothetical protein
MRLIRASFILFISLCLLGAKPAKRAGSKASTSSNAALPEQLIKGTVKATAADFLKDRTKKPRFSGAFEVGFYTVTFPDTYPIDPHETLQRQTQGVTDYFKKYTQNVCWPTFRNLSTTPYRAPHPLGYYTRYHVHQNKIGWTDESEGQKRVKELREAALRHAGGAKTPVTTFVYATRCKPLEDLSHIKVLRDPYPLANDFYPDQLMFYNPTETIRWADPLWPNSSILLGENAGAGTLIHELGHVLGAPDYYHATEIAGGIEGTPVTVGGGPTGPLYCRWKYCATLPDDAYQMITKDTTITLAPRWSEFTAGSPNPLGIFIPTSHPNYLLHLEYEPSDPQTLRGNSEDEIGRYSDRHSPQGGIYIYYINVTQGSSYVGHPDLCYVYRPDDPTLRGYNGGVAVFREGDAFDATSNPKNILPNQLPTGVEIAFGQQTAQGATLTIKVPRQKAGGTVLKQSYLPIIEMKEITDIQPTTLSVETDLTFRGEPLAEERGIVYGSSPNPVYPRASYIAIHGQGFNKARITNLRPGATLYVRAYAKNKLGVSYSKHQQRIQLPRVQPQMDVAPLCIDHLAANDWQTKNYSFRTSKDGAKLNGTVMISLLKLMVLQRTTLDGAKPKGKGAVINGIDFNAIHLNPHANRYPPTLQGFTQARNFAEQLAETLGLHAATLPEDLDKRLIKTLKYPSRQQKGKEVLVNLEIGNEAEHEPRIRASLLAGWPVLCVRESSLVSSPTYALDACLIDGVKTDENGTTRYHIFYPTGIDRLPKTNRSTGWHPLEVLTEGLGATGARLLFLQRDARR